MDVSTKNQLKRLATQVRLGIIESVYHAKSGHPGGSLSIADTITYIYNNLMHFDSRNPKLENRDRFVLSKGHTAPALYSILSLKGFFPVEELKNLRKINCILQGHPDMKGTPGVDMSTGSLGQGISAACGIALSAKIFNMDYKVYCILGDGEIQEGQVWEAFMFASHNKLDNLIAIVDNNGLQIDGRVSDICSLGSMEDKFKAFGCYVTTMDAHDFDDIERAFSQVLKVKDKPKLIIQNSIKGKGISFMEDVPSWHGVAPNRDEYEIAVGELTLLLNNLEELNLC